MGHIDELGLVNGAGALPHAGIVQAAQHVYDLVFRKFQDLQGVADARAKNPPDMNSNSAQANAATQLIALGYTLDEKKDDKRTYPVLVQTEYLNRDRAAVEDALAAVWKASESLVNVKGSQYETEAAGLANGLGGLRQSLLKLAEQLEKDGDRLTALQRQGAPPWQPKS